jgi:hypothetical protein
VKKKRQKVQQAKYVAGMALPMPEIMFQVVSPVFQYVIRPLAKSRQIR